MSEPMTGADLGHLEDLATTYAATGRDVAARAVELRAQITTSVAAFRDAMDRLRADTERAATAMTDEVNALSSAAGAVAWTGANRLAFDAGLERFAGELRAGTTSILDGVHELRAGGVERFAELQEEFGRAIGAAADGVEVEAGDLRAVVATQRDALHQAGDVGWMSA
jgi:hypothetical protein